MPTTVKELRQQLVSSEAKRLDRRSVSRAAQWQYVVRPKGEMGFVAFGDNPKRAGFTVRRGERYMTQVAMRSLLRHLNATGNAGVFGANGELVSGFAAVDNPEDVPYTGVQAYEFVGPVAAKAVLGLSHSWYAHRDIFKKQAAERKVDKLTFEKVTSTARGRATLKRIFGV